MNVHNLHVWISREIYRKTAKLAKKQKRTIRAVLEDALTLYLAQETA